MNRVVGCACGRYEWGLSKEISIGAEFAVTAYEDSIQGIECNILKAAYRECAGGEFYAVGLQLKAAGCCAGCGYCIRCCAANDDFFGLDNGISVVLAERSQGVCLKVQTFDVGPGEGTVAVQIDRGIAGKLQILHCRHEGRQCVAFEYETRGGIHDSALVENDADLPASKADVI